MSNYWEPHSASVDFCEPNYHLSSQIVEVHNVWSSLIITYFGVIGLLYGNATSEYSVAAMYTVLAFIGVGSASLHATLHWIPQSSDEVPMLWQALTFIHMLYIIELTERKIPYSFKAGVLFVGIAAMQTYMYYRYQHIYAVFICSIIVYSILIVVESYRLVSIAKNEKSRELRRNLWKSAFVCYAVLGAVLWIIDMNLCDSLLPYYSQYFYGCTLHVFWHIFAGLGTYLICVCMVAVRMEQKGKVPQVKWLYGLPICTLQDYPHMRNE